MKLSEPGKLVNGKNGCLKWSAVRLVKNGEKVCGDVFLIHNYQDQILVAVIDGLGHGEKAYNAGKKAIKALKKFTNQSLVTLIKNCHNELIKTRGVAMSIAIFESREDSMTWTGIGNVDGSLFRDNNTKHADREDILLWGGVVGYKLPFFKVTWLSVSAGDTLIFTTDGVKKKYIENVNIYQTTKQIAENIATNNISKSDDALVLVARYTG